MPPVTLCLLLTSSCTFALVNHPRSPCHISHNGSLTTSLNFASQPQLTNLFDTANNDRSRLPSLYSDLNQLKATNPDGFKANATAWATALKHASLAGQLPVEQKIILHTSQQLLESLRNPQYGEPSGLGSVIDYAISSGQFMNLSDFQQAEQSIFQKPWIPTPLSIVKWTLRKAGLINAGSYDDDGRLKAGQLVLVEGLDLLAKEVSTIQQKQGQGFTDRIVSKEQFTKWLAETEIGTLSNAEIDVLLRFMSRDRQLLTSRDNTIKFAVGGELEPVTEDDASIASIKAYIASLEISVANLESKVQELQKTAQVAVQNKNRHAALSALRSKKRAEEALESRTKSLDQVQDVFSRIEQAADQQQIMQVMQTSAQTLRSLNQKVGGVEKVDQIMDNLREEMAQTDEVGQVLREPLDGTGLLEDVDDELAAMEKEEQEKKDLVEAEKTRQRLTELEKTKLQPSKEDADLEEQLSNSASKFQGLQLDDNKESEKIPQPAI